MKTAFTIILSRMEVNWLYRQLRSQLQKAEALKKDKPEGTEGAAIQNDIDVLTKLIISCKDLVDQGEVNRLGLDNLKRDLQDALIFCEEPEAKAEAQNQLDNLPKEEDYRVTFDRETAKFTLKMLIKEIEWIRATNIPNLEKRDAALFEDKILTRSYYINKAKRAKSILEEMKKKLEKELL